MSNRTAIIASAIIAGCASIISITSISTGAVYAADECLASPKATTPAGGHWYYRIEKGTKRKCWYLGDAGAKVNKTVVAKPAAGEDDASEPTAKTSPATESVPQKPIRKSVANARAELTTALPDEDPALAGTTWPPLNEPASNTTTSNDNQTAAAQPRLSVTDPSSMQSWTMASRWPQPNAGNEERAVAPPQEPARQAPALTAERLVTAAATTGAATADPTPVAVTTSSPQAQAESDSISIGILLSVLVGVLALAAIIGPVIFKYAKPRKLREATPATRRPIWDLNTTSQQRPLFAQDDVARKRPVVLDDPYFDEQRYEPQHPTDTTADEIEELLARASRRSAA